MKWFFPENDGGQDSGFHNAGVETFTGDLDRYLARELIQNCLDARLDPNKPVQVKFDIVDIPRNDIPDVDCLKVTLERCTEYWKHESKARIFFERAERMAKDPIIRALRVSDSNTSGVIGHDAEREKSWYNLSFVAKVDVVYKVSRLSIKYWRFCFI